MGLKTYKNPLPEDVKRVGRTIDPEFDKTRFSYYERPAKKIHSLVNALAKLELWEQDDSDLYFDRLKYYDKYLYEYLRRRRRSTRPPKNKPKRDNDKNRFLTF